MTVTDQNRLGIAVALKQIYDEQNRIIRGQVLAVGTAADGARQFLRDLVTENTSAAQKIHDVFRSAYDGVNDNLAKLITGQKTSWGSFFTGLSQQIVKLQLAQLEKGIASTLFGGAGGPGGTAKPGTGAGGGGWSEKIPGLGSLFGLGKRDGSTPMTALYVIQANGGSGLGGILRRGASTGGGGGGSSPIADLLGGGVGVASSLALGQSKSTTNNNGFLSGFGHLLQGVGGALHSAIRKNYLGSMLKPKSSSIIDFGEPGDVSGDPYAQLEAMNLFGGFHADGGDVDAGKINVVGERGPELFIPRSSGTVVPNSAIRGGGAGSSQSVTQNFIAVGEDPAAVQRASSRAMVATHNAAVANAVRVINDRSLRTPQQR